MKSRHPIRAIALLASLLVAEAFPALPACLDGYALYSHTQSVLGARNVISSGKSGSNGFTEIGIDGISQSEILARGNILLRDRTLVSANVKASGTVTLLAGAQVTGTVSQGASVPLCTISQESFATGNSDVTVSAGALRDLAPGSYRDVQVFGNGTLKLGSGNYYFKSLRTEADGKFQLNPGTGNIQVFISTSLTVSDRTQFLYPSGDAPKKLKLHSQQTLPVAIGCDIQFKGTVVAPNAEIHVFSRTHIRGAAYGKSLVIEPDVQFTGAPFGTGTTLVEITSPADGYLTRESTIPLAWKVNGVVQTAQTTENLLLEGFNRVIRCSGTACDTVNVIRDQTPPMVVISSPTSGSQTNQTTVPVTWRIDGVVQSTQITQSLPVEGANVITRSATDAAGNTGTASVTVIRDTQPPVVAITSPMNGSVTNQTSVPVAWSVDGVAQSVQTSQALGVEGSNTISRTATDAAGNTSTVSITVTRDTQPPVVAITSPANGLITNQTTLQVGWMVDGVVQTAQTTETIGVEGTNIISRSATDAAGNVGSASISITRDTQPPIVMITSPAGGTVTNQTTVAVSWTVDGVTQTGQTSATLAVEGNNTISRSATDAAGNTGASSITVTRDTQPPVVAITSPATGLVTNQTTVPVSWTIDGVAQTGQTSETLPVEGTNTISRTATDAAGNTSTVSLTVTRDTQPPVVAITSPAGGLVTNQPSVPVSWTVDGVQQTTGLLANLVQGPNAITRTAADAAGNSGSATITVTYTPVDTSGSGLYAKAHATPDNGGAPLTVTFTGIGYDNWGPAPFHKWDFDGDGVFDTTIAGGGDTTLLRQFDFETGPEGFTFGGASGSMGLAHGGSRVNAPVSRVWTTNTTAQYLNDMDIWMDSPPIAIPAGATASLSYRQSYDLEQNYDFGYVAVDNGNGFEAISAISGFQSPGVATLDLSNYAGSTIRIRFQFVSDFIVTYSGWQIDDILVTADDGSGPQVLFSDSADDGVAWELNPGDRTWVRAELSEPNSHIVGLGNHWLEPDTSSYSYAENLDAWATSPVIALPADGALRLAIYQYLSTEFRGDGGRLEISRNGGPFALLEPYEGYWDWDSIPGFGKAFTGDMRESRPLFDLSPFAGDNVRIRFRFYSNDAVTARGWIVDSLRIFQVKGIIDGVSRVAHTYASQGVYPAVFAAADSLGREARADIRRTTVRVGPPGAPTIAITSPADGSFTNQTQIPVAWTVGGVLQDSLNTENLVEGLNTISRSYTDGNGYTGTASVLVGLDTTLPVVAILAPTEGAMVHGFYTSVAWSVDGVLQTTDTTEYLWYEGTNTITRIFTDAAGNADTASVQVIRDAFPPDVRFTNLPNYGFSYTNQPTIRVEWTVDGVPQTTDTLEHLVEGENLVERRFTDAYGAEGYIYTRVYLDATPPVVDIQSPIDGDTVFVNPLRIWYAVDGVPQPTVARTLVPGMNTIVIESADEVGNVGADTVRVFFRDQGCLIVTEGDVHFEEPVVRNCLIVAYEGRVITEKKLTVDTLLVTGGGSLNSNDTIDAKWISVGADSWLNHAGRKSTGSVSTLYIKSDRLSIQAGAIVDANRAGYAGGQGPDGSVSEYDFGLGSHAGVCFDGSVPAYGSHSEPVTAGSGGGNGSYTGSAGGGVVRIETDTLRLDGEIRADGETSFWNCGAGGSIWITAGSLTGSGRLSASGGDSDIPAGGGRIAVYADSIPEAIIRNATAKGCGGGSLYFKDNQGLNALRIDTAKFPDWRIAGESWIVSSVLDTNLSIQLDTLAKAIFAEDVKARDVTWKGASGVSFLGTLQVPKLSLNSGYLELADTSRVDSLLLEGTSLATHRADTTDPDRMVYLISDHVRVGPQAGIDVSHKGFPHGRGPDGQANTTNYSAGGSHASRGYNSPIPAYGDARTPRLPGGGGGRALEYEYGGAGGGVVRVVARTLDLEGRIVSDGEATDWGSGAGGSIWLTVDTLTGNGKIAARGGIYAPWSGSGGRIAVHSCNLSQAILDSIDAGGGSPGTIFLPCQNPPVVTIHSPAQSEVVYQASIPVRWSILHGDTTVDEESGLQAGFNDIVRCSTNPYGLTGCDTNRVLLDPNPPVVKILSPADGSYHSVFQIPVSWMVDSVIQHTDTVQNLVEGLNRIVRTYTDSTGSRGSDTIYVVRDTKLPSIELIDPAHSATITTSELDIRWMVDSVEQVPVHHVMDTSKANVVMLRALDSAGHRDSLAVYLYSGIAAPDLLGLPHAAAESLLAAAHLGVESTWVDNDSVATGLVFEQSPNPGEGLRYHFPVRYRISRGTDAVDLKPIALNVDSMTVNPNTLAAGGKVQVKAVNLGRVPVTDSFDIVAFEDRNLDGRYSAETDLFLGKTGNASPLGIDDTLVSDITVSGMLTFNGNRISVSLDQSGLVPESHEDNNVTNSMAECRKLPDSMDYQPLLKWSWTSSTSLTGIFGTPLTANMNDDNGDGLINEEDIPDVIVAAAGNSLSDGETVVLDGKSGQKLWSKVVNHHSLSDLAVGDVDGDGKPEVVNVQCGPYCWDRRLVMLDNEGEVKAEGDWHFFASIYYVPDGINLSDLDGDGKSEVIWGPNIHDYQLNHIYPKTFSRSISPLSVVDLDADGYKELIGNVTPEGSINSYLGVIGFKEKKILHLRNGTNAAQFGLIGKVEDDSGPRIIKPMWYYPDTAVAAETYGLGMDFVRKYPGTRLLSNPPGVYDVNSPYSTYPFYFGTGSTRKLITIGSNSAHVPNTNRAETQPLFTSLNLRDSSTVYRIFPQVGNHTRGTVFDFNDDGHPEAVLVSRDTLYVLDSIGSTLAKITLPSQAYGYMATVSDVDKDGHADLLVGIANPGSNKPSLLAFSNPTWVGARGIFNQLDYTVTNVEDDGGIPRFPTNSWEANNTTNVQCAVGHYACVDMSASFPQVTLDSLGREQASARIGNGGALELPAGIPVSVYYSHLSGESRLTTLYTPTRLKPGQYYTAKALLPEAFRGSYSFRIAVDDSGNGRGNLDESNEGNNSVAFTFLVNNTAPSVAQPANQYAEPSESFAFQVQAEDAEGDTLAYALTRGPVGMTLNAATGAILWTPSQNPPRCTVEVAVSDPYQGNSFVSFIIYVGNANNLPPVISSTPGLVANLNTMTAQQVSTYTYSIQAADPESEGPLEYALNCLNCEGKPGSPPQLAGNLITWRPFQPFWLTSDSLQLSLRVIDARGGIAVQAWTLRLVRNGNGAPAFAAAPNTQGVEEVPWKSPVTVFDLDDDPVTLMLDTIPVGITYANDSLRWTPTASGAFVVRIGATDGFDTTYQRFVVTVAPVNDAPRIVSAALTTTIPGALYVYQAAATDEDGDVLTFSLAQAPSGMTVSATGRVEWRPAQSRTTPANVELVVSDPSGAEDRQAYTLSMVPDTVAPTAYLSFSKNPSRPGTPVTVTLQAGDNVDIAAATLTLDGVPVTLSGSQYVFTPSAVGNRHFQAVVTDPSANTGSASAILRVSNAAELTPPEVAISVSPSAPTAGETVTFTVTASDTDGVDLERLWVEVDGISLRVTGGTAQYAALRPGALVARAVAFDSLGASAQATAAFTVSPQGGDAVAPTASLTSPAEDSVLYGRVAVLGTASDANLAYYTLSYRDRNESGWVEYARQTDNVVADTLGSIDATALPNGDYEIRLAVHDRSGNFTTRTTAVTVAGEKKIGAFTLAFQDLSLPMSGLELAVTRTYDSRVKTQGDFGMGWKMGLRSIALHENRNQGRDWVLHRTPGLIPQYSLGEGAAHSVTVTLPGGRKQEFQPKPRFFSAFNPTFGVMEYEARPGTYSRLEAVAVDTFLVMGGELYDQHGDFEETFNPQRYRLTLLDGSYFVYDKPSGGVIESGDANGNVLEWQGNALRHNAGNSIHFTRDSLNRISSISDSAGRGLQYRYDVAGNLHEVLDANGHATRFRYGPDHYLEEVIDGRGVRAARTEYDADGRMVRQINAQGDTLELRHDLAANEEEVVDFAGHVTTYTYDARGNVLSKTDDAGHTWTYAYDSVGNLLSTIAPGGGERSSTYDSHGNELTSTDELENTTTRTYDAGGRVLTSEDPLGRVTEYRYDSRGNLEREIGPDAVQSVRSYDSRGNLLTEENALGHVTTHTYDANGWLTSTTDPLGRVLRYGHDGAGNVTLEVDAAGDTTRHAYDGNGNRIRTVNALGDTLRTEYNAINKVTREIDARGNVTRYAYNALGDRVADTAADGTVTLRGYDGNGNLAATTDPVGRVTEFEYDHEKRLVKTTFEDGSTTVSGYDALGRRMRSVDANGNETEYEYDDAGRNTVVRDALGHETRFEYDDAGRKTAMVDALDRRTEYEYDAYDRLVLTRFEDGTTRLVGYDLAGRKVSETDQAGKVTGFEYDSTGNLTAVVDALGNRTEYTYDSNNNRISQKDANNHTTTLAYDALNRLVSRTYPGGNQERWTYDAQGNMLSHVKGTDSTAFQYDALNRESHREYFPSGHEVTTTYTPDGKRDSVIDYRGLTRFAYDNRGRLSAEAMPNGDFLEHDYDAQGNRIRVVTPFDSTEYRYDALNRMDSVVARSGVTRYHYNAVGNRDSVLYPNGTSTGYAYDSLNRLTEVRNWSPADTLLSRFTYTLNAAGIRTAVEELDGSKVTYGYDDLYRLTSEARTGSHAYVRTFGYDDVGNRLLQVVDGDTTAYTYNSRDQLTEEEGPAGTISYGYDPAGRQTSKTTSAGTTSYLWVDDDRLDSISGPGVAVAYTYDSEGRKVKETTPDTVRQFLVDRLLPFGQVILETNRDGDMVTEYVYGLERISQERGGNTHWYLTDGQGSVRQLADSNGFVSDTYAYIAFGEPLASTGSTANDFKYVGEQLDGNSGFYYNRARWADSRMGRFVSVDPFAGDENSPVSLHRYLYANASPISFSDPTGQFSLMDVITSVNIQSVVSSIQINIGRGIVDKALGQASAGDMAGLRTALAVADAVEVGLAVAGGVTAAYAGVKGIITVLKSKKVSIMVGKVLARSERGTVNQILQGYPEGLKVGYRGSLATGVKHSTGRGFNPNDFDVDAFIVSDELRAVLGKNPNFSTLKKRHPDLYEYSLKVQEQLRANYPGNKQVDEILSWRIYTEAEYKNLISQGDHVMFGD